MSLIVWLPLNGDLENQGLSNVTVTNNGATVDNNGKIGKCYNFNGTDQYLSTGKTPSQIFSQNGSAFSLCAWVYMTAKPTNQTAIISSNSYQQYGIGIGLKTNGAITFMYMNSGKSHEFTADWTLPIGKWSHIIMSYDSIIKKGHLYLDGKLKNTYDITIGDWVLGTLPFLIGKNQQGGWPGYFNGKMNDVRIYDHALSAKEIKELAKGLVLHYRLAGPGRPNLLNGNIHLASAWVSENHTVANYSDSNFTGLKITATQANGRIYNSVSNLWVTNNAKYTVSFWAKSDTAGTTIDCSRSIADFSPTFTLDTKWKYYSGIITTTGTSAGGTLSIRINQASRVVYIANIKVENGVIATPFIPPSNSSIYSVMGYNNNVEYDCSGYHRNGAKSGNITWDIDSPRYTTSYKFNTGSDYIKTNFSAAMDELSISFWVKPSSSNGGYSIICSNYNNPSGGLWLATNCEGCSVWAYCGAYMNVSGSLANNTWHHCVYTFKAGVSKWYINGEEKALTGNTYTGTTLWIGDLTIGNSYTGTSWNTKRYGNLSDFRLYSTALSAEDIAELYHSAIIVDNTGKNYAYEYFEA